MEKVIYKYKLAETIEMPVGAKVLTVDTQNEEQFIWALVDKNADMEIRNFTVVGTGNPFRTKGVYVGTYMVCSGMFVFHVFDEGN